MFEVTVEDSFAARHYLRNYKGKCENPHGHNYKIRVTLAGPESSTRQAYYSTFKDLKEVMKHVIDRLDHKMIMTLSHLPVGKPVGGEPCKIFLRRVECRVAAVITNGRVRIKDVTRV
jgi:6-pyruvoyltetrahydropterin/6-carboxytetrahydropterin synthase